MAETREVISDVEARILQFLADGKRPSDIASSLHLSINVVNIHLVRIREKYEAPTTYNALATAIRQGIID
jgi:DNA-binding CsgD family transcriptional regulator